MATKSRKINQAKPYLKKARAQAEAAAVDSWEPAEPAQCIAKCFYAYENALTAAAFAAGKTFTTNHQEKAQLAATLVAEGVLSTDVSDQLTRLNHLRKDVQYGSPGDDLADEDLEDLLGQLEGFLDEVEALIEKVEGK